MVQRPGSLPEFEAQFPDDEACARWLFGKRWPDGFRCPGCGHAKGWELGRGTLLVECARCRRQTSVTAGTVLHRSHLPLKLWFLAAWLVATHKNGMSARQLWLQLGLGSYKTAWLLLRELRRAMVDPEREPLAGLVEVDETSLSFRTKDDPVTAKPGRSHEGRLLIAGAVEIVGKGPGRVRLTVIGDYSAATLNAFVAGNVAAGSTVVSDGWSGYATLTDVKHDPRVIGDAPAHLVLPWIHRVFANAKRWALGVYHGLRRQHLQTYLDEFVFRFNRRRNPAAAFERLLGLSLTLQPATYRMLISSDAISTTRSPRGSGRPTSSTQHLSPPGWAAMRRTSCDKRSRGCCGPSSTTTTTSASGWTSMGRIHSGRSARRPATVIGITCTTRTFCRCQTNGNTRGTRPGIWRSTRCRSRLSIPISRRIRWR